MRLRRATRASGTRKDAAEAARKTSPTRRPIHSGPLTETERAAALEAARRTRPTPP